DVQATSVSDRGTGDDGGHPHTPGGSLGLDPPRATVRVASLLGEGGERIELVEVGAEQGGLVHVRRIEDGAFATVPAAAAAALFPDELSLRAHKVLDLRTEDFRGLRIAGPLGTQA